MPFSAKVLEESWDDIGLDGIEPPWVSQVLELVEAIKKAPQSGAFEKMIVACEAFGSLKPLATCLS